MEEDIDLKVDQALEQMIRDKKRPKREKEICKALLELSPHREKKTGKKLTEQKC
jgi:hypothetical protein